MVAPIEAPLILATVVVGGQGAAVDRHGVELGSKTTNRDITTFAAVALYRDAGNALQRLRHVLIGQFA
jgi:hypothetical protein